MNTSGVSCNYYKSSRQLWKLGVTVDGCSNEHLSVATLLCSPPHWLQACPHALHWPRGKGNISKHESDAWKTHYWAWLLLVLMENIHHVKRTGLVRLLLPTQGWTNQPPTDCSNMSESRGHSLNNLAPPSSNYWPSETETHKWSF